MTTPITVPWIKELHPHITTHEQFLKERKIGISQIIKNNHDAQQYNLRMDREEKNVQHDA